ncbi:MAG: CheR family methyltransferase [Chloroflexota bacterium]
MTSSVDPALAAATEAAGAELTAFAGLEVEALGPRAVERAVRARLRATGLTPEAWVAALRSDTGERSALVDAVVVPETMLFRDGSPFEALHTLAARRAEGADGAWRGPAAGRPPVRVLSAACSTGEEAYSAAIALLAGGLRPVDVSVVALDLSATALAVAASGVLPRTAARGPIPAWADRYLDRRADGTVAVAPAAREVVELRTGNVLDAPEVGPVDAALCRNLLIYLTAPARARVTTWLAAQLGPGAPLFVGHAEVAVLLDAGWRRAPEHGPYALVPGVPGVAVLPVTRSRPASQATAATRPPAPAEPVPIPPTPGGAPARRSNGVAAASTPGAAAAPTAPPAPAAPLDPDALVRATGLAESGDRDGAIAVLDACVAADPSDVEAHALLGILHATAGRPTAARAALRRALYLDPDHAESRAQLALLDRSHGSART